MWDKKDNIERGLRIELSKNWSVLLLAIVACIIYLPGLPGGFLFDDFWNILDNPAINTKDFSFESAWAAFQSGESGPLGRPLPMLSFYLNYQFFGASPLGYKLVNIAIHALNSVLVFLIVQRFSTALVKDTFSGRTSHLFPFLVALFWSVHPINLTTVLYVVQRMNELSAFFLLVGVWLYLKIRQENSPGSLRLAISLGGVVFCGVLSMLCKENGALLFLYLFVIEISLFFWKTESVNSRRILVAFYVFVLLLPVLGIVLFYSDRALVGYEIRPYTLLERLMTQSRVIWFYIHQILLPQVGSFGLYHDDFKISDGLLNPAGTLFSIIGLALLVIAAFRFKKTYPLFSFGILWFLCGHLMESTVLPLDMVYEHRNYLPSIGMIMILIGFAEILSKKGFVLSSKFFVSSLLVLLVFITAGRAFDWRDPLVLAERTAQHHPESVKAHYDVGFNYLRLFDISGEQEYAEKGEVALMKAVEVSETEALPYLGLLLEKATRNISVTQGFLDKLALRLKQYPVGSPEMTAVIKLANCQQTKSCKLSEDAVIQLFNSLLKNKYILEENRDSLLENYGIYLLSIPDRLIESKEILEDVAKRYPDNLQYQANLANALIATGEKAKATILMDSLKSRFGIEWNFQEN